MKNVNYEISSNVGVMADVIRAIVMEFHFHDEIKEAIFRDIKDAPEDRIAIEYGRYILKYDYDKNIIFVG